MLEDIDGEGDVGLRPRLELARVAVFRRGRSVDRDVVHRRRRVHVEAVLDDVHAPVAIEGESHGLHVALVRAVGGAVDDLARRTAWKIDLVDVTGDGEDVEGATGGAGGEADGILVEAGDLANLKPLRRRRQGRIRRRGKTEQT
jgi:hypothetical protein